jgi:hypothetical protein
MSQQKSAQLRICIICKEEDSVNNKLVDKHDISLVRDLKERVVERASLGDVQLKSLADHLSSLSESDLRNVCYHSKCRKPLVNKANLEMCRKRAHSQTPIFSDASSTSDVVPVAPKRGRPPKTETSEGARPLRQKVLPKEKKCVFHTCSFCPKSSQELHKVSSDPMGQWLLAIKEATKDDLIRLSLAELSDPGDAAALEKYYHRDCLRVVERHCKEWGDRDAYIHVRNVCDAEFIVYVRDSLIGVDGCVLSMNELNNFYLNLLKEKKIHEERSDNHKKHLKELIEQHVPDVEFVEPPNPSHSHRVMRKKSVGQAVEFATADTDAWGLLEVSHALRKEVLGARDWKFTGDFNDFENPPMLEFIITHIMYGSEVRISGQREAEVKKNVDVVCQLIVQSSRSQRQIKLKTSHVFKKTVETPLSIGLPLAIHSRVRDENLVSMLSTVYIGSDYKHILNLQKRVEFAVQQRMLSTGGYCLPDFAKRNVPLWFAVDNIAMSLYNPKTVSMVVLF